MSAKRRLAASAAVLALLSAGCGDDADTASAGTSEQQLKVGFITKFPVDFYDTMVTAVKDWNKSNPDVQVIFAQGKSGTDDEGEIAAIQSMVTQGVKAIA